MKKIIMIVLLSLYTTYLMGAEFRNVLGANFYFLYTDAEYKPTDISDKENKKNFSPKNFGLSYYYVSSEYISIGFSLSYNTIFSETYNTSKTDNVNFYSSGYTYRTKTYNVEIKSSLILIQPSVKIKLSPNSPFNLLFSPGIAIFNTKYSFSGNIYTYDGNNSSNTKDSGSETFNNKRYCLTLGLEYNLSKYDNIKIPIGFYYDIYNIAPENYNPILKKEFSNKEETITGIRFGLGISYCFN